MSKSTSSSPSSSSKITREKIHRLRLYIQRRKALYDLVQRTLSGFKSYDQLFVIIMAVIIGITSGFIAAGFRSLIAFFQKLFWGDGIMVDQVLQSPLWLRIGVPVIVLVVVAYIIKTFATEAKGHGVPEVMEAVALKNGFIRMRVVLVKALASALTIGGGGAVGREGPIVQIGAAFGSSIGQIFQVSTRRMRTLVGCGAAAGIAATFNAPIAGALFASEIILGDFSVRAIGPIMISSVLGTVITRSIYGDFPAFVPPVYTLQTPYELIFYALLGIVAGVAGWAFIKTLYSTEDLFDNLSIPLWAKASIGGVIIGIIAIFFPQVMGVGYETMDLVLAGQISLKVVGGLLLLKILATSVSLGAGGSGGIFAPSLFIGSMLGATMGSAVNYLFPGVTASSGAYALVGMAAVVSAATHAPITAILIIFEMTSEYTIILPLMISSIIAVVITNKLIDGSIYTLKLKRRGVDIHGGTDINVMNQLTVEKIKRQIVGIIEPNAHLPELLDMLKTTSYAAFFVCNDDNQLEGVVTTDALRRYLNRFDEIPTETTAMDIANLHYPTITEETPVNLALRMMTERDIDMLPVVDENNRITGQLNRVDIIQEYQELLIQSHTASSLARSFKYTHHISHEQTEVIPGFLLARIDVPSSFVGFSIPALDVRKKHNVDVLLIRKKEGLRYHDKIPTAGMRLNRDDQLLLFGPKENVERVCLMS